MLYRVELSFENGVRRYCYDADNPVRLFIYLLKKWEEFHEQYDFKFVGGISAITGDYTLVFNLHERKGEHQCL